MGGGNFRNLRDLRNLRNLRDLRELRDVRDLKELRELRDLRMLLVKVCHEKLEMQKPQKCIQRPDSICLEVQSHGKRLGEPFFWALRVFSRAKRALKACLDCG
jgi:hypothetical protein